MINEHHGKHRRRSGAGEYRIGRASIYWRSPGDAGIPTSLDWNVAGAEIDEPSWPAPHAFAEPDGLDGFITTIGYAGRVLLFADARVAVAAVTRELAAL